MSTITIWLTAGAGVVVALIILNALFYRSLHGTFRPRSQEPAVRLNSRLSKTDLLLCGYVVCVLLAAEAPPYFSPDGAFARWLSEPYAKLVYFGWALILPALLVVTFRIFGILRARRRRLRQQ